jgi:hypothetical protein
MARIMNASDKECIVYDPLSLQKALKKVMTELEVTFTPQKIDIVESRGNGIEYTAQYVSLLSSFQTFTINYQLNSGFNFVQGSLNWDPSLI